MRRQMLWSIGLVVLLGLPSPVPAWNGIGHMAIAKLAYDQLADAQKKKLFTVLQSHPHYEKFLAAGRPDDVSEVEWVIVRASIWPDWVRPREKDDRGPEVTKYHRAEDHYVNVPLIDPKDREMFEDKVLIDPDLTNILDALKQRSNEIKSKSADPAEKAIAACWLSHLVGDIHQPLHNVAYFSSIKEFRKGDLGGNLFGVRANGQRVKLHAFWDNLLGDDPNYVDDSAQHQARIYQEALKVAAGLRNLQLAEADQKKLTENLSFASWSQESHELAKTFAYRKGDGSGLLEGVPVSFKGFIPKDAPELGVKYLKNARAIAETRAVLAGQRLAARLTKLIKK